MCYNCSGVDDVTRCQNEAVCAQNQVTFMSGSFDEMASCAFHTVLSIAFGLIHLRHVGAFEIIL